MTRSNTHPQTPSKTVLVLLVLGIALAGVAIAPAASAQCVLLRDEGGLYRIAAGGCGTYVEVQGERILP